MLTNSHAADYGNIIAHLINPNNIAFDEIEYQGLYFDVVGFNSSAVTFKAKPGPITGKEAETIRFTFKKDGVKVGTSPLAIEVGVPLFHILKSSLGSLDAKGVVGPTWKSNFKIKASEVPFTYEGAALNVEATVDLALNAEWFNAKIIAKGSSAIDLDLLNSTQKYGVTAELSIPTHSTGNIQSNLTASYEGNWIDTGDYSDKFTLTHNWAIVEPTIYLLYIKGFSIGVEFSDPFGDSAFENLMPILGLEWRF